MATAATPDRDAARVPVRGLTVLYDAQCSLCAVVRDWLVRQRQLVPLELVPVGSEAAMRRFPGLDHAATLDEITVIGDSGQVYRGTAAWIVTLWALAEYRPAAHRFSTPAGRRLARGAVLAAAKWREGQWAAQARGLGQGCVLRGQRMGVLPGDGVDLQRTRLRQRHLRASLGSLPCQQRKTVPVVRTAARSRTALPSRRAQRSRRALPSRRAPPGRPVRPPRASRPGP